MILQVELVELRRMIKEKCDELFSNKKISEIVFNRICSIENDERFTIVSLNDGEDKSNPIKKKIGTFVKVDSKYPEEMIADYRVMNKLIQENIVKVNRKEIDNGVILEYTFDI